MTLHEYDIVALTEDLPAAHPETPAPILLRRGQVGPVMMAFDGEAFGVDFSDSEGQTYAMETIPSRRVKLLKFFRC